MENTLQLIQSQIASMTKSQKKIGDCILKDIVSATYSTLDEIANKASTSTASVVRFAIALGFKSFSDFQDSLRDYLKYQSSPVGKLEKNDLFRNSLETSTDGQSDEITRRIVEQQINNIINTYEKLDKKVLADIISHLSVADRVFVYGERSCFGCAAYLAYNLNRILGNTEFFQAFPGTIGDSIGKVSNKDMVFVFSFKRYINTVKQFTELCRKQGAFVVVITNSYDSPYSAIADYLLIADSSSYDFHNSMTSTTNLIELIISLTSIRNQEKLNHNLKINEDINTKLNIHS